MWALKGSHFQLPRLRSIMMLTAPIAPDNDDVMRRVFELMVGTLRDLDNSVDLTFKKKL